MWKTTDDVEAEQAFDKHEEADSFGETLSKMTDVTYVQLLRREIPNWHIWREWK